VVLRRYCRIQHLHYPVPRSWVNMLPQS
jgi:hypothetical protein